MAFMYLNQNKNKYLSILFFLFLTRNSICASQLDKDPSLRFLGKLASSHFSMKHIHDISYEKSKLTFNIGIRTNVTSKSDFDKNISSSVKSIVNSLVDSIGSVRSNFIEASIGNFKGFSLHFQTIPMLSFKNYTFTNMGVGLQWSYLDVIFEKLPFSAALKGYVNKTDISDSDEALGYRSTMLGFVHLLGKEWTYFSMFFGLGYAKTDASIKMQKETPNISLGGFHANVSAMFNYKYLRVGSEFSLIDDIKMISFKLAMVI